MNSKLIKLLKVIIVFIIFYYLYTNNHISIDAIFSIKENIILNLFLLILIFTTLLLGSFRWFLILKYSKISINFIETFKIIYICSFFNNFMFGNIGGDVLRVFYASKLSNRNKIKNTFTVFVDRLFGLTGLSIRGFISYVVILLEQNKYEILLYIMPTLFFLMIFTFLIINVLK